MSKYKYWNVCFVSSDQQSNLRFFIKILSQVFGPTAKTEKSKKKELLTKRKALERYA